MKAFLSECRKAKRRGLWLVSAGSAGFLFVWMLWTTANPSAEKLACGWSGLLYELPLLNTILLPVMMAVLASRLWDIEHKGGMDQLLYTLQSRASVWGGKTLLGLCYIVLLAALEGGALCLLSRLRGFTQALPLAELAWACACAALVSFALYLTQELLSIHFENQITPLVVGLAGSFLGLFSLFFPEGFQYALPWAYYGLLGTEHMLWDRDTRVTTFAAEPFRWWLLACVAVICAALFFAGRALVRTKEG